jgi:hypothetical protein
MSDSTLHKFFSTYLITPWCRTLFEKLIVTQLVNNYPTFFWNPKAHYSVHTSTPLDPILSQMNPACPTDPYLPKVHLNVIIPPTPRSSHWSLAFGPPNQNLVNTSPFPIRATCPAHLILLDLITLKYSEKKTGCEVHHYVMFFMIHLPPF